MADFTFSIGDIPAWLALTLSIFSFAHQSRKDKKKLQADEAQKIESNQTQERALTKQNEASKKALTDLKRQIRAEQMLADMDELLALTVNYWTQPAETASTSAIMIKSKIKDLSHRCSSYRSFLWTSASTEFMNIKRTITGGSFERKFRPALLTTSPLIQNASREIDNFKIKLRTYIDSIDELNNH